MEKNLSGRRDNALPEIEFAFAREKDCGVITDILGTDRLPLRVTHNDTKLNNVLFDKATKKGLCVVDLDTVMPASNTLRHTLTVTLKQQGKASQMMKLIYFRFLLSFSHLNVV